MHNKVIKTADNNLSENKYSCSQNLKYKSILIYLELICKSVNEAKQRLSVQREPFYYCAELNNDQNCVVPEDIYTPPQEVREIPRGRGSKRT